MDHILLIVADARRQLSDGIWRAQFALLDDEERVARTKALLAAISPELELHEIVREPGEAGWTIHWGHAAGGSVTDIATQVPPGGWPHPR